MNDLSARARRLLDSSRKETTPSAEDLQHLRARLSVSLAQQGGDPIVLPFSLSKLAGVLALAAVGLGGWYLRGALGGHERASFVAASRAATHPAPPPAAAPAPAGPPAPVLSCPKAPICDARPEAAPKGPVAGPPLSPGRGDPELDGTAQRGLQRELFSVERARSDPSLELQLLMLARVALDDDRPMDALGHVRRHEQLYPRSTFEEERLAIEVLAYCSAGDREQARPTLQRLLALAPETTYLPRIRGACTDELFRPAGEAGSEP